MTLVIGKRDAYNHSFTMMADKRIVGWSSGIKDTADKIIKLDNMLLGIAWDYIPMELIAELYSKWKSEKTSINFQISTDHKLFVQPETITEIVDFLDYIKDNSNIKDCQAMFMVLTKTLGFIYMESGSIEMMTYRKWDEWILAMWDSSKLVYAYDNICKDRQITLADFDYFDIVSELDATVSKEFLALSINNL